MKKWIREILAFLIMIAIFALAFLVAITLPLAIISATSF